MAKNKDSQKFGMFSSGVFGIAVALSGCASSPKSASSNGLQFSDGVTGEPTLSRAISRFCDSAYIAINESQEITPIDVLARYEAIRSGRKSWSSPYVVAELTKASLVSNKKP